MGEQPDRYVALTRWDAMLKLEQSLGKEVTLLGAVSDIRFGEKGPSLVKLSRNKGNDFDVVFWDKDVLLASGAQYKKGDYIQVRGVVSRWRDEKHNADRLQLVVSLPGQVLAPSRELESLLEQQSVKAAENDTQGD
jgi:hypothetical protein